MLSGLPGDRRLFEVGQVPGDAGGAGLQALKQRRRPGHRIAAAPAALGSPGGDADRVRRLSPANRVFDDPLIHLVCRETLHGDLRRADANSQIDSGPGPLIRGHQYGDFGDNGHHWQCQPEVAPLGRLVLAPLGERRSGRACGLLAPKGA